MLQGDGRPIPYKVIQETNIVPTFGGYLGGDLIDDYLGGSGSASGAWGDQALFGGGRPATGIYCGNKNTGIKCLD
jgi:hypothetical protein